ncbi:MAG: glycosyltransferase [Bacteroidales bacterium]|jgi:cellulose synthase/poly-beta-1,6-N-acetylglucosamine synthase-like glycosyltransferase|nr:glycosyltransferase [Bacteroidales bacterium]
MIALQIILFLSLAGILHSYVIYPILIKLTAKGKSISSKSFSFSDALPKVSVIMAAYNEEAVIEEKILTILKNDYPKEKLEILIGSDNSNDRTNEIIEKFADGNQNIRFQIFTSRQGKVSIVNQLEKQAQGDILILTDANVMFHNDTIFELVRYFKDETIGLVDAKMINTGLQKEGISFQEKSYISREVFIKHHESLMWGSMMGPFGGCYAIRKPLFNDVPNNFLVDDFFICMKVLEQNKKTVNNLDAKVFEDVSNNLRDEFHRKIRIATGNFQNLNHFKHLLWPFWKGKAFAFLSHKALRWLGPFFLIFIIVNLSVLAFYNTFYLILAIGAFFILTLPLYDILLKKLKIHNVILRFATHFFTMNLALLIGFFRNLKGVKTNVWKPTKRFQ